jgi:hypothetical protein
MHFKTFYLIVLFGTSLLSGLYLIYIWIKRKNTNNVFLKESNIALLLISISFFHRTFVSANKLFDIQDFTLNYIFVDRMISSVSNLIFLLSISYFPLLNEENKLNLFYYSNNKLTIFLENIKYKDFRNNLENIIKCNYNEISDESSRIIKKRVYLDRRFESFFLQVIKKIYFII